MASKRTIGIIAFIFVYTMITIYLLILSSCSTVVQPLSPDVLYKKDVKFWVNDTPIYGVGVAPITKSFTIFIDYTLGNIDYLSLTTCHRQINLQNEQHKVTYTYIPSSVEIESGCPLDIGVYDKKGRHGWGYLVFPREENKLPAVLECNGDVLNLVGTSICQGNIGTVQRISFIKSEVIRFEASAGCIIVLTKNPKVFEYNVAKGFCYFSFMDGNGNIHDHTSFGYESFVVRE